VLFEMLCHEELRAASSWVAAFLLLLGSRILRAIVSRSPSGVHRATAAAMSSWYVLCSSACFRHEGLLRPGTGVERLEPSAECPVPEMWMTPALPSGVLAQISRVLLPSFAAPFAPAPVTKRAKHAPAPAALAAAASSGGGPPAGRSTKRHRRGGAGQRVAKGTQGPAASAAGAPAPPAPLAQHTRRFLGRVCRGPFWNRF
jgi:hypothetical protein